MLSYLGSEYEAKSKRNQTFFGTQLWVMMLIIRDTSWLSTFLDVHDEDIANLVLGKDKLISKFLVTFFFILSWGSPNIRLRKADQVVVARWASTSSLYTCEKILVDVLLIIRQERAKLQRILTKINTSMHIKPTNDDAVAGYRRGTTRRVNIAPKHHKFGF